MMLSSSKEAPNAMWGVCPVSWCRLETWRWRQSATVSDRMWECFSNDVMIPIIIQARFYVNDTRAGHYRLSSSRQPASSSSKISNVCLAWVIKVKPNPPKQPQRLLHGFIWLAPGITFLQLKSVPLTISGLPVVQWWLVAGAPSSFHSLQSRGEVWSDRARSDQSAARLGLAGAGSCGTASLRINWW